MRIPCGRSFAAGVLLSLLPATASASIGVPISPQAPLNRNAPTDAANDERPHLATDGDGRWVAVWSARRVVNQQGLTFSDILVARSSDHGVTWSDPVGVNPGAPNSSGLNAAPFVSTDGNGVWLVAWASSEPYNGTLNVGTDFDVLVSRSVDNGQNWSFPVPVNTTAGADTEPDAGVSVLPDGNGGWRAFWYSTNSLGGTLGNDEDILTARSTDNGTSWTPPLAVNSNAATDAGNDRDVRAATDSAGVWILVWSSAGLAGPDRDIAFARSGDNGQTWSPVAALNSNAATDSEPDREPDIANDRNGTWLVVWSSPSNIAATGTDKDVFYARSTNIGANWTSPQPVNLSAIFDSGGDSFPALAAGGAGEFACVWLAEGGLGGSLGNDFDLLVARTTDSGANWTSPVALNSTAAGDTANDFGPRLFSDGQGQWIAAWEFIDGLSQPFGPDFDIMYARFALPDCNGNSVPDGEDIASGGSGDCNQNGIPDACEPDRDGDGIIDACEGQNPGGNDNTNGNSNGNENDNADPGGNDNSGDGGANDNANGNTNGNDNAAGGPGGGGNAGGGFIPPGGLAPVSPACGGCGATAVPLLPFTLLGIGCVKWVRAPRRRRNLEHNRPGPSCPERALHGRHRPRS